LDRARRDEEEREAAVTPRVPEEARPLLAALPAEPRDGERYGLEEPERALLRRGGDAAATAAAVATAAAEDDEAGDEAAVL
jgi:hypothetical protein